MNKIENENIRYQEDEIDLRELFRTLMKNKKIIILITLAVTLFAVVYALMAPKVYEAKAILKIGEYALEGPNKKVTIADASELSKELEILFIDILKNKKDRNASIENITLLKNQKNFLEITANGSSNETVQAEVQKVIEYVHENHKKILNDVKNIYEVKVKQIDGKLMILKTKTLPALNEKIDRYKKDIKNYEANFLDVQDNLKSIKSSNPTLATMQINEQRYLADILIKLKDSLEQFENQKNSIEVIEIEKLEEDLKSLKVLMEPYNYKNSEVVGTIMINDHPVKPKKKLIVIVAFVTGFILSIFLVFFLEFIRDEKEEKLSHKSDKRSSNGDI
jgi:LPS O-antigen subunit length determinant protein (WzzB/FepE family)